MTFSSLKCSFWLFGTNIIRAVTVYRAMHILARPRERVMFKLACLVRLPLLRQAPLYLADDCCLVSDSTRRSQRSADVATCVVPPTLSRYGDRTFAAAGPRLRNSLSLPVQLRNLDITHGLFRRQLKRHLCQGYMNAALCDKIERGALWPSICSALEKHLLTYYVCHLATVGTSDPRLVFDHCARYKCMHACDKQ